MGTSLAHQHGQRREDAPWEIPYLAHATEEGALAAVMAIVVQAAIRLMPPCARRSAERRRALPHQRRSSWA